MQDGRLPDELWLYIFHIAASEPLPRFDTSTSPPARSDNPYLTQQLGREENDPKRRKTRYRLTLVSKYWRRIAVPILFEYVDLRSIAEVRSFSRTLEDGWLACEQQDVHFETVGRFVRSIKLSLKSTQDNYPVTDEQSIAASFRFCVNVNGVHIISANDGPTHFTNLVLARVSFASAGRLQYITAYLSNVLPTFGAYTCTDTLEMLEIFPVPSDLRLPNLSFSRLHTLYLCCFAAKYAALWNLPSLNNVCIVQGRNSRFNDGFTPFFRVHGAKIARLDVTQWNPRGLSLILDHCRSPMQISVSCYMLKSFAALFPRLACIEINVNPQPWSQFNLIFAVDEGLALLYETRDVQKFKLIRLTSDSSDFWERPWSAVELGIWRRWIEIAKVEGVEFVFDCGTPVEIPVNLEPDPYYSHLSNFAGLAVEGDG
jgi:hypothetical protein